MKLLSFNVNGIRAIAGKSFLDDMKTMQADVICLQETKATVEQVLETVNPLGYPFVYANEAGRKGYSGTAIISKTEPISVVYDMGIPEHDEEGRVIFLEFYLKVCVMAGLVPAIHVFGVNGEGRGCPGQVRA